MSTIWHLPAALTNLVTDYVPRTIEKAIQAAACQSTLEDMTWMLNVFNIPSWPRSVKRFYIVHAAEKGRVDMVDYLTRVLQIEVKSVFEKAAVHGHVAVLEWFQKHHNKQYAPRLLPGTERDICSRGHQAVLEWILAHTDPQHERDPSELKSNLSSSVFQSGNMTFVQWFVLAFQMTHQEIADKITSAAGGSLDVLKWVWQVVQYNKIELNRSTPQLIWNACCRTGNMEMAKWFKPLFKCDNFRLGQAMKYGHLELGKWMVKELKIKPGRFNLHQACEGVSRPCIKWLVVDHKVQPDDRCLINACATNNWSIVEFIARRIKIIDAKTADRMFRDCHDLDIFKFLTDRYNIKQLSPEIHSLVCWRTCKPKLTEWLFQQFPLSNEVLVNNVWPGATRCNWKQRSRRSALCWFITHFQLTREQVMSNDHKVYKSIARCGQTQLCKWIEDYCDMTPEEIQAAQKLAPSRKREIEDALQSEAKRPKLTASNKMTN